MRKYFKRIEKEIFLANVQNKDQKKIQEMIDDSFKNLNWKEQLTFLFDWKYLSLLLFFNCFWLILSFITWKIKPLSIVMIVIFIISFITSVFWLRFCFKTRKKIVSKIDIVQIHNLLLKSTNLNGQISYAKEQKNSIKKTFIEAEKYWYIPNNATTTFESNIFCLQFSMGHLYYQFKQFHWEIENTPTSELVCFMTHDFEPLNNSIANLSYEISSNALYEKLPKIELESRFFHKIFKLAANDSIAIRIALTPGSMENMILNFNDFKPNKLIKKRFFMKKTSSSNCIIFRAPNASFLTPNYPLLKTINQKKTIIATKIIDDFYQNYLMIEMFLFSNIYKTN